MWNYNSTIQLWNTAAVMQSTKWGKKKDHMNPDNDEKAKDHGVVVVTLTTDWIHHEWQVRKFSNGN